MDEPINSDEQMGRRAKWLFLPLLVLLLIGIYFILRQIQPGSLHWPSWFDREATSDTELWQVTKVVDGDTIDVRQGLANNRVRLLGINTPEVVDPRKPVQCFGPEASAETHQLLDGKSVRLVAKPNHENRDIYNRLLRYVYLPDNTLVNLVLVQQGFAYEYTFKNEHYSHQMEFRAAQAQAKAQKSGLWSPQTCNGKL